MRGVLIVSAALTLGAFVLVVYDRPAATAEPGVTTIRFSFWGSDDELATWQDVTAAFRAVHPEVAVKLDWWPERYYEKSQRALGSGDPPDVMLIQDEPFARFCAAGRIRDLTDRVKSDPRFHLDRFAGTAVQSFAYRGRPYGMPVFGGPIVVFYHRALFDRFGVPYPKPDWTWDDFLRTCQALTRDTDGDGRTDVFGVNLVRWWVFWLPWVWGAGGDLLDPTYTRCVLDTPEAIRGLEFYMDLRWRHHVAPQPNEFGQMGQDMMFLTGRVAMLLTGPYKMPFVRQTSLDWDVAPMPTGPAGQATRVTWDCLAIPSEARHPDAAWTFVAYVTGPEGQRLLARAGRNLPARLANLPDFVRPDTPEHEEVFVDALRYARMQPLNVYWQDLHQIVFKESDRMLLLDPAKRLSPADFARRVTRQLNAFFAARTPPETAERP
jgi:multiple sugar transport system substrate-binding protein